MSEWKEIPELWWERNVRCDYCGRLGLHNPILVNAKQTYQTLVECECGLRFFCPRVSAGWIASQILEGGGAETAQRCFRDGVLNDNFGKRLPPGEQKRILRELHTAKYTHLQKYLKHLKNPPKILEVGSNVAWATKAFLAAGASTESVALDISPEACRINKEKLGLNVFHGPALNAPMLLGPFDLVYANDVIEHTYTPFQDLTHFRRLVKPGAVLYLKTFAEELDAKHGRTMLDPPWHSHHIKTDVLYHMLSDSGWTVLVKNIVEPVQLEIIARAI